VSAPEIVEELRRLLESEGADFEVLAHPQAVTSAEMGNARGFGALEEMTPTLIVRSEQGPLAAIISGATRLSYKKLKRELRLKDVSLATPEAVRELTGADVGSVSLVNPGVPTIVDARLLDLQQGFGGCGAPGYTLRIKVADLVRITRARVFDFTEPKARPTAGGSEG